MRTTQTLQIIMPAQLPESRKEQKNCSFSNAFAEDDFLKLVATGTKADGTTSTIEFLLADGNDYQTWALDWTYFDLSSLGEVTEVTFNMVEAQMDDYGPDYGAYYRTPFYFAFDDVEVEF